MEKSSSTKEKGGCCGGGKSKKDQQSGGLNVTTNQDDKTKGREQKRSRRARNDGPVEAKIVLLGESGVGKSSIALRFCQDRFDELHDVTIGGAYMQKVVNIPN